jgi:hypothetical protein
MARETPAGYLFLKSWPTNGKRPGVGSHQVVAFFSLCQVSIENMSLKYSSITIHMLSMQEKSSLQRNGRDPERFLQHTMLDPMSAHFSLESGVFLVRLRRVSSNFTAVNMRKFPNGTWPFSLGISGFEPLGFGFVPPNVSGNVFYV